MTTPDVAAENVYGRFVEEMDAVLIRADDPAVRVVGELTRAVQRAQMVVDGELLPVAQRGSHVR